MDKKERELQEHIEQARLLAAAVAHLAEGVLITSDHLDWPGPHIVFVNEAMCRITGYTSEELIGKTPRILQGEGTDRGSLNHVRAQLTSGQSCRVEVVNYRKDRTSYDAELFIMPVFNAEGHRTNFVSIHRDISERKQAEEALRNNQQFLQAIYDAEPECIKLLNADGSLMMMNQAGLDMIEAESLDEVQGKSVYGLIAPKDREEFESLTERIFRGESGTLEFDIVGLKGSRRTLETQAVPLRDPAGKIASLLGITRDITERKAAELALYESAQWMRAVMHAAVDAIITIDREGIIVGVNAATTSMFGYAEDELIGQNVSILMPSPYSEEHDGYIARYLETGVARIIGIGREVEGQRKDGSVFHVSLAISEVDHLHIFIGIVRDITQQVEAQRQLMLSERLATIGQTMAGIAHESRNSLQKIQASAEMLEMDLRDNSEAMAEVRRIEESTDNLRGLLDEVRQYAAPITLERTRVAVSGIWRRAWQDVCQVRNGDEPILEEETNDIDTECYVDPFRLQQVFRNLFENAIAACKDRAHVTVHCADSHIDGGATIEIAIRDRGTGFAEEHRDKVFDAFFTSKSTGTGLGMAIVKRIVEEHGGRVTIGPNRHPGAEVIVTLPRKHRSD
jgi:PAS domain S-box-containing protein